MTMRRTLPLAAFLASMPLVVFIVLALFGIGAFGFDSILLGLILGVPFWILLVMPVYLLSDGGRRWSVWVSAILSYMAIAALYLAYAWEPSSYNLIVGRRVLVERGVATQAYYFDLLAHIIAAGVAVLLGVPVFKRLLCSRTH